MRRVWSSVVALSAVIGWAAPAAAQAPATSASAPDVANLGEIVVTTQKREQNLREVPINVTAFTGEFLEDLGVQKFDELSYFVPGLQIQEQSPNNAAFVIRGITSDNGASNIEPRVAIFQDGVSISRSRGSYVELFDLERVEVAKGPQATLFGRGALIGGINLIQNKADPEAYAASVEARFGELDSASLRGMVNLPVVKDVLAVRVAGAYRERDGFNDNVLDGTSLGAVQVSAVRAGLRFTPTERFTLDLIANYQEDDNAGTSFKSGRFAPPGGDTSPFSAAALQSFGPIGPLGLSRTVESVTALAEYEINEALTLTSISGYRFFDSREAFDPDGFGLPVLASEEIAKGLQYSQELRLSFDAGGRISGFVGASFVREEGSQRVPLAFDERIATALIAGTITNPPQSFETLIANATVAGNLQRLGVPAVQAPFVAAALKPLHVESYVNFAENETIDLFGDLTFAVTEKLEVSAGLRWTQDDKTTAYNAGPVNGGSTLGGLLAQRVAPGITGQFSIFPDGSATVGTPKRSETFDDFTGRLVARYAFSPDLSAYASYARGRAPEVISPNPPAAPAGARIPVTIPGLGTVVAPVPGAGVVTFEIIPAETVDSVEVGAKARLFGGAVTLDGSVYRYQYENFQSTSIVNGRFVTTNAGEASATGFEGQVFWSPLPTLELFGNYAFNNAEFDEGAFKGNAFRISPEHKFSIGGILELPVFDASQVRLIPTYTWQSEVFFDNNNDRPELQEPLFPSLADRRQDELQDGYGLLNFRAEFLPADSPAQIALFVTNALDEEYVIDAGNTGDDLGSPTFIRGAPRIAGVELKATF